MVLCRYLSLLLANLPRLRAIVAAGSCFLRIREVE